MALVQCKECGSEVSTQARNCPKCGAPLRRKQSILAVIAGTIVVFGAIAMFMDLGAGSRPAPPADAAAIAAVAPRAPAIDVSADQLIADYEANTVAADMKYKGKRLRITGRVADINTSIGNEPYVVMGEPFKTAHLDFPKNAGPQLAQLKKGQELTAICIGAGDIAKAPMNHDCTFDVQAASPVAAQRAIPAPSVPTPSALPAPASAPSGRSTSPSHADAVAESISARDRAEQELNAAWKALPKEQRMALLSEQRTFNQDKETGCAQEAQAAAADLADIVRNECWTKRYQQRTKQLQEAAISPSPAASDASS